MQNHVHALEGWLDHLGITDIGLQAGDAFDRATVQRAELVFILEVGDGQTANETTGPGNQNVWFRHSFSFRVPIVADNPALASIVSPSRGEYDNRQRLPVSKPDQEVLGATEFPSPIHQSLDAITISRCKPSVIIEE